MATPQLSAPPCSILLPEELNFKRAFRDQRVGITAGSIICLVQECGGGKWWVSITIAQLTKGVQSVNALALHWRRRPLLTLPDMQYGLKFLHDHSCIILNDQNGDPAIDRITVTEEMIKQLTTYLILPPN